VGGEGTSLTAPGAGVGKGVRWHTVRPKTSASCARGVCVIDERNRLVGIRGWIAAGRRGRRGVVFVEPGLLPYCDSSS
jgi:hypothetical protein